MSLQIPCPHCGIRPVEEFVYGEIFSVPEHIQGEAARDFDRGFMHNNTAGIVVEAWFHASGCRRWVRIRRDTRSDQIVE